LASLFETFPPAGSRRLAECLKIPRHPKHGSWLNIAEIELGALNGQSLPRRLSDLDSMFREISVWLKHRNTRGAPSHCRLRTEEARVKRLRLYPKL
jgi:hypothetical protein